jgi:uncharacterized membrane protein
LRYLLAIGGLLLGAVAIFTVWMLVPKTSPMVSTTVVAAESTAAPSVEAAPPAADSDEGSLRVCNQTRNTVSIALGYKAARGWQSEGWWIASAGECKTVYSGKLDARYYYIYAADDISGGSWDGKNFMCTRDESFTIFGVEDCLARGYERTGFFEVDTQNRSNWMLQLTEGDVQGGEPVDGAEDDLPLEGEPLSDAGDLPAEDDNQQGSDSE